MEDKTYADIVEKVSHKHAGSIWKEKNLVLGVIAQFFYVGAQVCVGSFFIRFSFQVAGVEEKEAAYLLFIALFGFMVGRFMEPSSSNVSIYHHDYLQFIQLPTSCY